MKLFKKFFTFALTLTLVLGVFGTVPVSAASGLKLNKVKRTIYVGGCKVNKSYTKGKYTLKLKNLPSKYTVEWESSDPSVATVKNKNSKKTTVMAIAPGKCTVTAKVLDTSTKPNTMTELTCKITIKRNCAAVQITDEKNKSIDSLELKAEEKKELFCTMYSEGAKAMTPGKDVTDTVHFVSDKPEVVSIEEVEDKDGTKKFYAVAGKTAATGVKITCYTTPDASGNYSDISKATATDSITVNVGSANLGMLSLTQTTRDSVKVVFASKVSDKLTNGNFSLALGAYVVPASEVTFDTTGTIATVKFASEFIANVTYSVDVKNASLNGKTSMDFTASNGVPARMELYTKLNDNKAVVGTPAKIYFRLYDAKGVDVTPLNADSDEYKKAAAKITWSVASSTSEYGQTLTSTGELSIVSVNKTVTVMATYVDGATKIQGLITVTAVSAASTLKYIDSTIVSTSVAGADIDWSKTVKGLSLSDDGSYKLVAKIADGSGKYIYSTDASSQIVFALASSSTAKHKLYVSADGQIWPLEEGTEAVVVYYASGSTRTALGTVYVNIGASRIPARLAILSDGETSQYDTFKRSDSAMTTNPVLSVAVLDNYGAVYPIKSIAEVAVTTTSKSQYGFCGKLNSDGTAELSFYGTGSATGTDVTYTITYTYTANGITQKLYKEIDVIYYSPDTSAAPEYSVIVVGSTDMSVRTAADLSKSVEIKLVDSRKGIRYRDIVLTSKDKAAPGYGYYFTLTKSTTSGDVQVTNNVDPTGIRLVSVSGKNITKMDTGLYTIHVFLKGVQGLDQEVATLSISLTDSMGAVSVKRLSETSSVKFTTTSSNTELNIALNQCFEVTIGGTKASLTTEDAKPMTDACYFRTIKATGTVTVDGTGYTITYPIEVDALVQTVK